MKHSSLRPYGLSEKEKRASFLSKTQVEKKLEENINTITNIIAVPFPLLCPSLHSYSCSTLTLVLEALVALGDGA